MKQETLTTNRSEGFSEAELDSMVKLMEILTSDLPEEQTRVLSEGAERYFDLAFGGGK